jgi:hypothetical protein
VAKQNSSSSPKPPKPIAVSNPLFKVLLWIIVGVLFASLLGMGLLAFLASKEQTEFQRQFASMCDTGFIKMTLGAIVGLLGGRAARPDRVEEG